MSFIGEAALSTLVEVLFQKITSSDLLKFAREKQVLADINRWKKLLPKIGTVLDDAEEKQMINRSVKNWLNDLKDLAYDVDILDEFATKSLQRKLEGEDEAEASTSKVRKLIPTCCIRLSPRDFRFNSEMASKIKEITARLNEINAQRNDLNLKEMVGGSPSNNSWQRPQSTSLHNEPQVYGRDEDKNKVLDLLSRDVTSEARVGVIPIVGMGGLGKTTLAQLIYNDQSTQNFQPRAWVCVSEDFDIMRITRGILESITSRPCVLRDLNQIQVELHKELVGKKYLIVLDDVWSEHYEDWHSLQPPFMDGAPGCRIIVTTRSEVVARNMGTIGFHTLQHISGDDCWQLFRRHAYESSSFVLPNEEIIREKVMNKCGGLPLAARTLGGLLRSKPINKWGDILNSRIWSLQDDNVGILPVLRLSYYHLPSQLKRCFAYCALFPKDYEFTEMELVLLWIAEGLIQQTDYGKEMEEVGSEYLRVLVSRSLFQAASSGGSKFVMHDLVSDLAQNISGETCLRLEDEASADNQLKRERARHSSYVRGHSDGIKKLQSLYNIPHLRTFLPVSIDEITRSSWNYLMNDVPYNLLPKSRCLRVLSLKGYHIYELPNSISYLKQLRYLDLSFTRIGSLPDSIVMLCNLQTLILRGCQHLVKLPLRVERLINLRYLDIERTGLFWGQGLPLGVNQLTSLRTLSECYAGKVSGTGLSVLKNLKYLRGRLCILQLENVANAWDGREANLEGKKHLCSLSLNWSDNEAGDEKVHRELLDGLKPHAGLEELHVSGYRSVNFPVWVAEPSFFNLVVLELSGCRKCTSLPTLGLLQSLRELVVEYMYSVKSIGFEFYGEGCYNPFPALETLCFRHMYGWESWNPCGFNFPCLLELTIQDCIKLSAELPSNLSTVKTLVISNCNQLLVSLQSLPVVSLLKICRCKEVDFRELDLGSPDNVELKLISKFTCQTERLIEQLNKSKNLSIDGELMSSPISFGSVMEEERGRIPRLQHLELDSCESFLHCARKFASLEQLIIRGFPQLKSLQGISFSSTLRVLEIRSCPALASLANAVCLKELLIDSCHSLISITSCQLPSTLENLVIQNCRSLQYLELFEEQCATSSSSSLTIENNNLINLEHLSVRYCPSLSSVASPTGKLPSNLKHLKIKQCSKLKSIAGSFSNLINLEVLSISNCQSLISLSSSGGKLPSRLTSLAISECSELDLIADSFSNTTYLQSIRIEYCGKLRYLPKHLDRLVRLHEIIIHGCQNLVSISEGALPTTRLKILNIYDCDKVVSLPDNIRSITSRQQLKIQNQTAVAVRFQVEGFPTNLTTLDICNVMISRPLREWGLHRLINLARLSIKGGCPDVVSFPCDETGIMLPPSLIKLCIMDFPNLECLSRKGLQNLVSLEELVLFACPMLASFPDNGLPRSLLILSMSGSPQLQKRCLKDEGEDWFKISHIPAVFM